MTSHLKNLLCILSLLTVLLVPYRLASADLIVFNSDFESGIPGEFSGPGFLDGVQGFAGLGNGSNTFSGQFLRNSSAPASPSTLTLTDLPDHTHVDVDFLLAILESWDGGGSVPGAAPDLFGVRIDGTTIFEESFETTNVSAQSYIPPTGVEIVSKTPLGFWGHSFPESGYDMGLDPTFDQIAHTDSTLVVEWFASGSGWQGGADESWAIDNITISLGGTAVPEPASTVVLAVGALVVAGLRRRRRPSRNDCRPCVIQD